MATRQVTIKDVAKQLNTSVGSVSKALTGKPGISDETRKKIIDTAKEMGYTANRSAQCLARKPINIAIVYPYAWEQYFNDIITGIREALEEAEQFKDCPALSFMLGPHAIYTCDTDYLGIVIETAKQHNLPLHIHLSETRYEVSECIKNHGCSPVKYLNNMGFFDQHTVAAHCVYVDEEDRRILAERGVFAALNPKSNMKLGNGFAPVAQMLEQGVNTCLGTDSAASNNSLDLFSEMNFTALIHKGTAESAQSVSAQQVLKMATSGGAAALGLSCGKLEVGRLADIVLLDLNRPQFCPRHNLPAALCYSANGSEVDTVLVGGNVVVEQGKLTQFDETEIYRKAQEAILRVQN